MMTMKTAIRDFNEYSISCANGDPDVARLRKFNSKVEPEPALGFLLDEFGGNLTQIYQGWFFITKDLKNESFGGW